MPLTDLVVLFWTTAPLPQLVVVVVWLMAGAVATTTGAGTVATSTGAGTAGDTWTREAGAGSVSTSLVLEKHPERITPIAADTINDERCMYERIVFTCF